MSWRVTQNCSLKTSKIAKILPKLSWDASLVSGPYSWMSESYIHPTLHTWSRDSSLKLFYKFRLMSWLSKIEHGFSGGSNVASACFNNQSWYCCLMPLSFKSLKSWIYLRFFARCVSSLSWHKSDAVAAKRKCGMEAFGCGNPICHKVTIKRVTRIVKHRLLHVVFLRAMCVAKSKSICFLVPRGIHRYDSNALVSG